MIRFISLITLTGLLSFNGSFEEIGPGAVLKGLLKKIE